MLQEVDDTRAGDEAFALLDALWETAPVGLVFFDRELRFRRVNGAVLDIGGGTVDERLGQTVEAVHGEVGVLIADVLRGVLADGRARSDVPLRGRLWHGRGPLQEWRLYSYPVRTPDGEIAGVGLVVVDVTAAARTRREVDALAAEPVAEDPVALPPGEAFGAGVPQQHVALDGEGEHPDRQLLDHPGQQVVVLHRPPRGPAPTASS